MRFPGRLCYSHWGYHYWVLVVAMGWKFFIPVLVGALGLVRLGHIHYAKNRAQQLLSMLCNYMSAWAVQVSENVPVFLPGVA